MIESVNVPDRELAHRVETGTGELRLDLTRRLAAEAFGTSMLIVAVVGSGIAASRLSAGDPGLQLLENAAATACALAGLILMFGAVSGAHFNPAVTLLDRLLGTISARDTCLYVVAQVVGGCVGTVLANLMFELPAVALSTTERSSAAMWLSEVLATVTLLVLIQGCVRTGRTAVLPFAVGIWIGGAYWFTSSTSFANPAVTIARTLSDTFAGIAPSSAPMFIVMQLAGTLIAFGFVRLFYPQDHSRRPVVAPPPASCQHDGGLLHRNTENLGRRSDGTFATDRRRATARTEGANVSDTPEILVVCTHNAGRSVAARVLLDHYGQGRVVVRSAGSEPGEGINPAVAQILTDRGLDVSKEFPKPLTAEAARSADVIITMGCGDACPVYPGKRYLDWEIEDPAGKSLADTRRIRGVIRLRVESLLHDLGALATP